MISYTILYLPLIPIIYVGVHAFKRLTGESE